MNPPLDRSAAGVWSGSFPPARDQIERRMAGTLPEPFAAWFAAPGLDAAAAPARDAGRRARRRERAADRAHRRRQDAGRLPADAWSILREAPRAGLHTLYVSPLKALATDIARNLMRAGRGDAACRCRIETRTGDTPANRRARQRDAPPQHPADHAGKPRRAAVAARCAGDVRRPGQRRDGRGARAGRHQARRPAGAVRGAAGDAGAGVPPRRAVGHRGASGGDPAPMPAPTRIDRGSRRRAARTGDDAAGGRAVLVRPHGPGGRAAGHGAHPRRRHDHRVRQHPRPGRTDVPGAVEAERRRRCRSRCTTARWRWSSAAASRRRWRRAGCAPWWRRRRSISASTGAAWTR